MERLRYAKYKNYMTVGSGLRRSNLRINGCFLCHADRFHPGGRSVYLCQMTKWRSLNVHMSCYTEAINVLQAMFPNHPFAESLG